MKKNTSRIRNDFLEEAIKQAATCGWNYQLLLETEKKLGLQKNYHILLFPGGIKELVNLFEHHLSSYTEYICSKKFQKEKIRVRDKVKEAVMVRLRGKNNDNRMLMSKLVSFYREPANFNLYLKNLWKIVDCIWYLAGDESTDFNHYTKRTLLFMVYRSSLLYYISDQSKNAENTEIFLEKKIAQAMNLSKIKQAPKNLFGLRDKIPFIRLFNNK